MFRSERFRQKEELKEGYPLMYEALVSEKKKFGYKDGMIYVLYEDYYVRTEYGAKYYCPISLIGISIPSKSMRFYPLVKNTLSLNNGFSHASYDGHLCIGVKYDTPLKQMLIDISSSIYDDDEELDVDDYIFFLKLLDQYVTYESSEGVPYEYFKSTIFDASNIKIVIPKDYCPDINSEKSDINPRDYIDEIAQDCLSRLTTNYIDCGVDKISNEQEVYRIGYYKRELNNIEKSFLLEKGYLDIVGEGKLEKKLEAYPNVYIGEKHVQEIIDEAPIYNKTLRITKECLHINHSNFEGAVVAEAHKLINNKGNENYGKRKRIENV